MDNISSMDKYLNLPSLPYLDPLQIQELLLAMNNVGTSDESIK
jgi:hypothetical protein